ncbi:MAG: heme exporter protein CcmB [bacterium]|nr:heme exporter protein CcmB [bacterium]
MSPFFTLIRRDLKVAFREGGAIGTALGFYLIVVSILSIGIGPDLAILSKIAPGVLWGTLLLSALLSVDRIFHNDFEDGTLEVIALGPLPLELVAVAKATAHWISTAIPLVLMAPVLGMFLNLPAHGFWVLVVSMLAGTPAVSFLGAVGAGLTLGLGRGGQLLSLLILPLYIPVLIFGISTMDAVLVGPGSFSTSFSILGALSLATVVLTPFAAAAALRMNLQ